MRGIFTSFLVAGGNALTCTGSESFDDAVPSCGPTDLTLRNGSTKFREIQK